ncbi:MAG: hypothetical protein GC184_14385 [Rhizobiales bacterium]|nr:hypothetical protein [Hyphomicrobiales bacterium]
MTHLVRQCNPDRLFDRFLDSYLAHDPGYDHDLVILMKGFDRRGRERFKAMALSRVPETRFLEMADEGFDINAYKFAAENLESDYLVFLNSYSKIECDGWLAKMLHPFEFESAVGVTGATGSWETINDEVSYPNAHIRTNAFAVQRHEFLSLDFGTLQTKWCCRLFEAGQNNMTRQLQARGLQAYLVGCDGVAYPKESWPRANVFRCGRQENLLISDNQTTTYIHSIQYWRRKQSRASWGEDADPYIANIREKLISLGRFITWKQGFWRLLRIIN